MHQGAVQQSDFQADLVAIQPAPGAVFLSLRRTGDGGERRSMLAELTLGEAIALRRELDDCIGIAAATGSA